MAETGQGGVDAATNAMRIRSFVREVPVEAQVGLRLSHVTIERRPVDRAARPPT